MNRNRLARASRAVAAVASVAAVAVGAASGVAVAYWTATDSSNPGAAQAETLPAGATPTATRSGTTATVTFATVSTSAASGQVVLTSYRIQRYAATGGAVATTTCTPTISAGVATCTVSGLPNGSWWFTDTPVLAGWVGGESAKTASPVTVAPAALSFASARVSLAAPTLTGGSLSGFAAGAVVTFTRDAATGTALPVTGGSSGTTVTTDGSGAASGFTVDQGTSQGAHTIYATDSAGDAATFAYTEDTVAPTTTDNTATIGTGWKRTAQTVVLTAADATSGVAATYNTTDGSTPTTGSALYGTGITLSADGTYAVKYFSVDQFGNAEAVRTSGTVRIDRTAPVVSAVAAGPTSVPMTGYVGGSFYVYANASDATSGVATVTADLHLLDGVSGDTAVPLAAGGPWTVGGVSYGYRSAAFTVGGSLATGATASFTVGATDVAGNAATARSGSVSVDKIAPTATDNAPTGWQRVTSVTVTISPGDTGGSGLYQTFLTTDGSTPSPANGTAGTSATFTGDGTYQLAYVVYDNAGNASAVVRRTIQIDRTAPLVSALAIGPQSTGTAGWVGTGEAATVYAAVTDATSGVSTVTATLQAGLGTPSTVTLSPLATPVTVGGTTYNYSGSFTTASSLPASSYTFSVTSTDVAGNSGTSSGSVGVDTTAPTGLAITTPSGGGNAPYTGTFAGTAGTDTTGSGDATTATLVITNRNTHTVYATYTVTIVNGSWSITGPALPSAPYTATLTQSDGAGNTTSVSVNFQA